MKNVGDITGLLRASQQGDQDAFNEVFSLVYEDLRRIAHKTRKRANAGHTLSTTGLVNEAYLRLANHSQSSYSDRAHFFAVAAQAMRQILINYAKKWSTTKRGGDQIRVELDRVEIAAAQEVELFVSVDSALKKLSKVDERLVRVVECRFFAGLTEEETAQALDVSERTVQRDWMRAKAWLKKELSSPSLE